MAKATRKQVGAGVIDGLALAVERPDGDVRGTVGHAEFSGEGETALGFLLGSPE